MPSADDAAGGHTEPSFAELVAAYFACRRTKRNSASALAFEQDLERNLVVLHEELRAGAYRPGPSICFVVTRPRPREVWAAGFRDRIVHHLLYRAIAPRFEAAFIADSCACIAGRGTLYAAQRLEHHVRGASHNWSRPAWYLKCDAALARLAGVPDDGLFASANSYFGLLRQASKSHHDRAQLANAVRRLGRSVDRELTKSFR